MTNNTDPVRALIDEWREEAAECHAESETPALKRDPRAYAGFASASRILTRCADEAESTLASAPPSAPVGVEWPAGVLSREQTMKTLREHNAWRRGARGPQTDSRLLGLALDAAIAALAQQPAAPEGCGACGDGCANRPGGCRLAEENPPAAPSGEARILIGWRTDDYLYETSDIATARSWMGNVGVLPIFEGDPNTKLAARQQQGGRADG